MEFSASAIPITPEQVLRAAGVLESEANEGDELLEGNVENQRIMQLNVTKRLLGIVQAKPRAEQEIFCHKFCAQYLPKLAEAYRDRPAPNDAVTVVINMIGATFYFVRFLLTPEGASFLTTHARRIVTEEMIPYEDEHNTVAEVCQFLATLLALGEPQDVPADVRGPLLQKLKAWRARYRGRFAQETADRCILMLEPSMTREAIEMGTKRKMMQMMLGKGVTSCKYKSCSETSQPSGADLLWCSRCKARYCGAQHQRADWPTHKQYCFAASF